MRDFELLDIVRQKPNKKLKVNKVGCPYCGAKTIKQHSSSTTLLGGENTNHEWHHKQCKKCGEKFIVETRFGNVWVTDEKQNVLSGMPSCFENYIYDCKCGGKVHREYTDMRGNPISWLSETIKNGERIKHYRTFWECDKCKTRIETKQDYYIL